MFLEYLAVGRDGTYSAFVDESGGLKVGHVYAGTAGSSRELDSLHQSSHSLSAHLASELRFRTYSHAVILVIGVLLAKVRERSQRYVRPSSSDHTFSLGLLVRSRQATNEHSTSNVSTAQTRMF